MAHWEIRKLISKCTNFHLTLINNLTDPNNNIVYLPLSSNINTVFYTQGLQCGYKRILVLNVETLDDQP